MALLANNDKLKQDNNNQPDNLGEGSQVGTGALVGNTSNVVTSGTGGNATAPGAQGAWTNIQAYLNANKGNTGSAQYFDNKVNETFEKEKQDAQRQADESKQRANEEVEKAKVGQDQASQIINQTAQNYNYSGQASEPYSQGVNQLKTALNADFTGPTSFNYGLSSEAQKYGNVGDNGAFKNIMEGLYNESAGGQMNRGQLALQRQLDVSNVGLKNARQKALERYAGLNTDINNLATQTTQDLSGMESNFRQNQNALKDYLNNQANLELQARAQAEADARAAYQGIYTGDKTGRGSFGEDNSFVFYGGGWTPKTFTGNHDNLGINAGNMTWQQMQQELAAHQGTDKAAYGDYNILDPNKGIVGTIEDERKRYVNDINSVLNNFYSQQEAKYQNTGDSEKRRYNTIMDILENNARLDEGFNVRG